MTVGNRLLLGVLLFLAVLIGATATLLGLFRSEISATLGRNAQSWATGMSDEIDRDLFHQIEGLQELATTSPRIGELLDRSATELEAEATQERPLEQILAERDREWVEATPEGKARQAALVGAPVSDLLRARQEFFHRRYGFETLGEIFLTDRFGGNVAETAVTSDYLQSDEGWWQQARDKGFVVEDPEWDESAKVLAVQIAVRIDNAEGQLAGILKAVLDLAEIRGVVERSRSDLGLQTVAVEVLNRHGERVFVDGDTSVVPAAVATPDDATGFQRVAMAGSPRREVLMAWTRSRGYRDFGGPGWTVRLYVDSAELLAPLQRLNRSLLGVASVTLLLAIGISVGLGRSITRPINRAVSAADQLARGDYAFEVTGSERGELGRLLAGLRAAVASGRQALRGVVRASGQLGAAAAELIGVSAEISKGAQRQLAGSRQTSTAMTAVAASTEQLAASSSRVSALVQEASASVEEMASSNEGVARHTRDLARAMERTAASLGEMAASIQQVAGGASRAHAESESAVVEASDGGEAVARVISGMGRVSDTLELGVEVMRRLEETHREVILRVGIIDDICDETDLLAVNAAIEAAHAGEQGRTFAVVATEIRKLSERSAAAAGEIAEVLETATLDVAKALEVTETGSREAREGEEMAAQAGEALHRIGEAVEGTRRRMLEISAATEEQARASADALETIESIRRLALQVEQATEEQAQGSQRIAGSVAEIRDLADEVSAATVSQSQESERVARALGEIHRISQQHAETVTRIASISQDLRSQAEELEEVAGFFQLSADEEPDAGGSPGSGEGETEPGPTTDLAEGLSPAPVAGG